MNRGIQTYVKHLQRFRYALSNDHHDLLFILAAVKRVEMVLKRQKFFLVLIVLLIVVLIIQFLNTKDINFVSLSKAKVRPKDGKNIFFIESGESTENVTLNPRQACAIESAAYTNPHLNVFFVYSSEDRLNALKITPELRAVHKVFLKIKIT